MKIYCSREDKKSFRYFAGKSLWVACHKYYYIHIMHPRFGYIGENYVRVESIDSANRCRYSIADPEQHVLEHHTGKLIKDQVIVMADHNITYEDHLITPLDVLTDEEMQQLW